MKFYFSKNLIYTGKKISLGFFPSKFIFVLGREGKKKQNRTKKMRTFYNPRASIVTICYDIYIKNTAVSHRNV
jgi:hypothetical protein